jgi:hypothetical protein
MYVLLISQEGIHQFAPNSAYALKPGKYFRMSKLQKSVLGLSHGKDCFCTSETKHNRGMAPRPKVGKFPGFSSDEDNF